MEEQSPYFEEQDFADYAKRSEATFAWEASSGRIVWANQQGLKFWGAEDCRRLSESELDPSMPALKSLGALQRDKLAKAPAMETLTFWTVNGPKKVLCRCEALDPIDGRQLILVTQLLGAHDEAGDAGASETKNDSSATKFVGLGQTELFAKISHEVRTPLNSIIGFSEMMKAESYGPLGHEKYKGYVDDILMSARHALSLINDLLDISKLQAGEFEIRAEAVDVNEIAGQCVSAMEPIAQAAGIDVAILTGKNVPAVMADPRALKQILFNLLSNAIKFTPEGGSVSVSTFTKEEGQVVICVEDSGVGMTDDEVEIAFKPFRQLGTAPRPQTTGSGLGLPLARALAEAHGARFELSSVAKKGTRVQVIFDVDVQR